MRRTHKMFALLLLALATGLAAPPAWAQRSLGQGKRRAEKPKKAPPPAAQPLPGKAAPSAGENANTPGPDVPRPDQNSGAQNLPPQWAERLQRMPPVEQERFLNNNERFRRLPPEKKERIRERLRDFRQLSPEERENLRKRASVWEKIPPEQRQRVRQEILPKWKQMAPDRREEIKHRLNALNGLSDEERAAKLRDPEFVRGLSPSEQGMLKDLSNLRVTAAPGPEGDH